jgi:hypothetical protein
MTSKTYFNKDYVKGLLRYNVCTIQFYKKDGTIRNARGTTNSEYLMEDYEYTGYDNGTDSDSQDVQIHYFDVEEQHWKSFILNRLISIISDNTELDDQTDSYLVVDGVKYDLEEVQSILYSDFCADVLDSFNLVIKHLRKPKTLDDWKQAVLNGKTTDSFDDWKIISRLLK